MTQLDLNLLVALDCLLEEGSVHGAADRMGLSSPAMSRTLGRIRRASGDQILVRTGHIMLPTPYASAVRQRVHELVQGAQEVLQPQRPLVVKALVRTFTLQFHDALTSAIAPGLLAGVRASAPGVTLCFVGESLNDGADLRRDRVDLVIGSTEPVQPDLRFEVLTTASLAVALRRDHPLTRARLDLRRYADAEHVTMSRRGRIKDPVDTALAAVGLHRRVIASAPTSEAALRIVSLGDALTSVSVAACQHLIDAFDLATMRLPMDLPPVPAIMSWHRRFDNDPAHRWLREQVRIAIHQLE